MTDLNKVCFLNSNDGSSVLAFGEGVSMRLESDHDLEGINTFIHEHAGNYLFTCLSYDLKNEIETLTSQNTDEIGFPNALLWRPDLVFKINGKHKECVQGQPTKNDIDFLESFINDTSTEHDVKESFDFQARTPKSSYLNHVNKLKKHIQRGDIYEVNYCQEYISYNTDLKSVKNIYFNLNKVTKTPFSSFFQFDEFTIFCCSPERFLRKNKQELLAQPIKGTSKRGASLEEDKILMKNLKSDPKERAENIMIVDLMRNDLSKIAQKNSVHVNELCGVYSFETVHQMISTVSCVLKKKHLLCGCFKSDIPHGLYDGSTEN